MPVQEKVVDFMVATRGAKTERLQERNGLVLSLYVCLLLKVFLMNTWHSEKHENTFEKHLKFFEKRAVKL